LLRDVDGETPGERDLHLLMNNDATQKTRQVPG
jgi:hypothetical protein